VPCRVVAPPTIRHATWIALLDRIPLLLDRPIVPLASYALTLRPKLRRRQAGVFIHNSAVAMKQHSAAIVTRPYRFIDCAISS
jgi:hypothetical protein